MKTSGYRTPDYNHNMAAGYAHLDQFDQAIKYQEIAIDIVTEREWTDLAKEYTKELKLYQQKIIPEFAKLSQQKT